jgi:hypothetical protein
MANFPIACSDVDMSDAEYLAQFYTDLTAPNGRFAMPVQANQFGEPEFAESAGGAMAESPVVSMSVPAPPPSPASAVWPAPARTAHSRCLFSVPSADLQGNEAVCESLSHIFFRCGLGNAPYQAAMNPACPAPQPMPTMAASDSAGSKAPTAGSGSKVTLAQNAELRKNFVVTPVFLAVVPVCGQATRTPHFRRPCLASGS